MFKDNFYIAIYHRRNLLFAFDYQHHNVVAHCRFIVFDESRTNKMAYFEYSVRENVAMQKAACLTGQFCRQPMFIFLY